MKKRKIKKFICYGVMAMMICLSGLVLFGQSMIVKAGPGESYAGGKGTQLFFVKEWDDDDDVTSRPEEITFTVTMDPTYSATSREKRITLKAEDNWTYKYPQGNVWDSSYWGYHYGSIEELKVNGYTYVGEKIVYEGCNDKGQKGKVTVILTNKREALTVTSEDLGINGIKTLAGRDFQIGDEFKFEIRNSANAPEGQPLPDKAICEISPVSGNTANIEFGTFTFKKPGKYIYVISEYIPQQGGTEIIPSITYDTTGYRLTVDVENEENTNQLKVANIKIEKSARKEVGTWVTLYNSPDMPSEQYCNFTNMYSELEQTISLTGTKVLENKKLSDYGNDQFKFFVEAVGKKMPDGSYEKDSKQPMPDKSVDGIYTTTNLQTGGILLPDNTFTKEHIDIEYRYTIKEMQPTVDGTFNGIPLDGAYKIDENGEKTDAPVIADGNIQWVYKNVVFDNHVHIMDVVAENVENADGQMEIKVSIKHDTHNTNGGAMKNFVFVNKYRVGTLIVSNSIDGNAGDVNKAFNYTITLSDKTRSSKNAVNGKYGDMEFVDGVAKITLKHGESKKATGLPADITYEVVEHEANTDGYVTIIPKEAKGVILADKEIKADFINTKNAYGDLTVTKEVTGTHGNKDQEFHFTVTLSDNTINGKYGDMEFKDGVAEITLKHGESKKAIGLLVGVKYTVEEKEADTDGYTTTTDNAEGIISENDNADVKFTNHKEIVSNKPDTPENDNPKNVETGDQTNVEMFTTLFGISAMCIAVLGAWKKKEC